jgi:hypothetical protein
MKAHFFRSVAAMGVLLACTLAVFGSFAAGRERAVPVMIGGSEELDACGGWAEVSGLNPKGDGFLAVRSGPGTDYPMRDRLREGDGVYVCRSAPGSKWLPIVYPRRGQDPAECAVSSGVAQPVEYRGPCGYGWVRADWIKVLAG